MNVWLRIFLFTRAGFDDVGFRCDVAIFITIYHLRQRRFEEREEQEQQSRLDLSIEW